MLACLGSMINYTRLDAKLTFEPSRTSKRIRHLGKASWYSKDDPGINFKTANNEIFDDRSMTCAMWGVPFNQWIRVTNRANGKSIVVRVNDRGPNYRFVRSGRIVDLTKAAFREIAPLKRGIIDIELEIIEALN
jgi:rare lipoprotein A